ncbi:hypothetical protein EMCRGX_G003922 [Ephydatia muelleri]
MESFSSLASRLAITSSRPKSAVLSELYGRLNLNLVRANSLEIFNSSVHQSDNIQIGSILEKLPSQKTLSSILDDNLFRVLQGSLSIADRARLLSASSPHASSWLTVTPSEGQGLHLDPPVFQTALKWWLGLDTAEGSICALCPDKMLDPLGHHATTCKRGGDVVFRHNKLRDILAETCRRAHLSVQVEAGCNLTPDHSHSRPADVQLRTKLSLLPLWVWHIYCYTRREAKSHFFIKKLQGIFTEIGHNRLRDVILESCRRACIGAGLGHDQHCTRPADVLVPDWVLGKPAAFDITVTSSLNPSIFTEASAMAGSAEQRKHHANDAKCSELEWKCVPLAVESYWCWGIEARQHLARLASRLATRYNQSKSQASSSLYGRLNLDLVRTNVRALLSRSMWPSETPTR